MDRGTFETFRKSIDPRWIEQALQESGTATVRKRSLPAEQVIWLVLGMALFRNWSIRAVVKSLDLAFQSASHRAMSGSAVTEARARLGSEPLKWFFEGCAQPWAISIADRHRWRGLSVFAVDGTSVGVPDSAANREHFGGHGSGRGDSAYPLVRLVTLMVLRSHLQLAAKFGPYRTSELALAQELWPMLPDHSLTILDGGFLGAALLLSLQRGENRQWLIPARSNTVWKVVRSFADGDELVEMKVSAEARRKDASLPETWTARAVRYQRPGFRPRTLLTSLLDPKLHPAKEIVALYHERWELELGYNEVKLEREESIRSRKMAGVRQGAVGLALAYNLVRLEMERVAHEAKVSPTRISIVTSLRYIRQALEIAGFISPGLLAKHMVQMRGDLRELVLPPRRSKRSYPRVVKLKMTPYNRKQRPAPVPTP